MSSFCLSNIFLLPLHPELPLGISWTAVVLVLYSCRYAGGNTPFACELSVLCVEIPGMLLIPIETYSRKQKVFSVNRKFMYFMYSYSVTWKLSDFFFLSLSFIGCFWLNISESQHERVERVSIWFFACMLKATNHPVPEGAKKSKETVRKRLM